MNMASDSLHPSSRALSVPTLTPTLSREREREREQTRPQRRILGLSVGRGLAPFARLFAGLLGAAFIVGAAAQDRDASDADDPPGRVGRLSEMTGQVWLYSAGEWLEATRNRPITSGDRLATDGAARAELRIGSTTVRLDSGTELEVVRIDDSRIELYLHDGSVAARLRSREAVGEFEVRTDEGVFRAQRTGRYRIDRIDEASHLTVLSGQAMYEGPGSALTVYSGQRAEFWLDASNAAQYSLTEPKRDAFAAWNNTRDRGDDRSASTRYVSPEMTGVEDLDRHGRWEQSDEHGALWIPRAVPVGWAPYSTGHWVWISPWGWTWVDDAPWGFAPFHYGRWVYYRSNWCWTPGTRVHRPVYAPALVAWVGGPRVSVSVSVGGPVVGWFPLAPREVYVPSYRVSPRYVREVNHTHVTHITNVTQYIGNPQGAAEQRDFSNRKFAHAVTVVPTGVFTQRQPVAPAARSLREHHDGRQLTQELTRGATLVAAPVTAPATRQLEAQSITSPGIGNAAAPGRVQRPWGRVDDERRGIGRPSQGSPNTLNAPNVPNAANAAISPAVPVAPAMITARPAVGAPPAVNVNPARPAPQIGAPAPIPQAHSPAPPVQAAPPHAVAPMPGVAPVAPRQEPRVRTPRAPGNEVPPATPVVRPEVVRSEAVRPVAPGITAARPRPERPAEPVNAAPAVRTRPAEPQERERGEAPRQNQRQDQRRDGRDRSQAN